jgi:hypothetical protein
MILSYGWNVKISRACAMARHFIEPSKTRMRGGKNEKEPVYTSTKLKRCPGKDFHILPEATLSFFRTL